MALTTYLNLALNKLDHLRYWFVIQKFEPVDTLMDIGCGNHPQKFIKTKRHYTVDPSGKPEGDEYWHINGTWEYPAMNFLRNNDIHTVVLMDVIEHLEKQDAQRLLAQTQDHVKQIIVFTPLGFMPQEDGEWNTHRSGWNERDFAGWEQHIFKHFHWCDFKGRVYPEPWPAIMAVWRK